MKITKTFYFGNEHTVVYKGSIFQRDEIYFNGKKCDSVEMFCSEWVRYVRTSVTVNDTPLEIIVFMKRIYILKDNVDIDTGLPIEPLVIPKWYRKLCNPVGFLPLTILFILTYIKSFEDPTYSYIDKVVAIMLVLIIYGTIISGLDRYFIVNPFKTSRQRSRFALITLILGAVIGIFMMLTLWILSGI